MLNTGGGMMVKFINYLSTGVFWTTVLTSTVIATLINVMWKFFENKIRFKNARHLQIDNYYRETSGRNMHKILEKWSEMLFLLNKPKVKNKMQSENYVQKLL